MLIALIYFLVAFLFSCILFAVLLALQYFRTKKHKKPDDGNGEKRQINGVYFYDDDK